MSCLGRTAFDVDLARTLIDRKRATPGATLPILHDLQEQFGYIDDAAIPLIADALNISRAETLGVVSFYHDFRRSPVDGRVLKLCRAESCQAMGCEDLVSHLAARHGRRGRRRGRRLGDSRRIGLLPRQLRPLPRRAARRRTDRPPRPRIASTRSSPTREGRRNERAGFRSRRFFCAFGRRGRGRWRDCRRGASPRRSTLRSCAPGRAASSGSSRSSRSRPQPAASATARSGRTKRGGYSKRAS